MLDEFRAVVTGFALIAIGMHVVLFVRVLAHRDMFAQWGLITAYAGGAILTLFATAARRLQDRFYDQPLHLGDFLGLVPIVAFLAVGVYGTWTIGRTIGSIEAKRRIDEVTQNVTYLEVRKLA
jgi:hypothetical protein